MKITIAEPVLTNPLKQFKPSVAERTRKALLELFPEQPEAAPAVPLSKEELKALKEVVYANCEERVSNIPPIFDTPEYKLLFVLHSAAQAAEFRADRVGSYRLEYAFQWVRAYLFKNKLPMPMDYPANSLGVLDFPYNTNGYMDIFLERILLTSVGLLRGLREEMPETLKSIAGYGTLTEYEGVGQYKEGPCKTHITPRDHMRGVVYTEEGTAWFAGFLNLEDVLKLRFRRMRLGAAVKEATGDDEKARKAADIRDINQFNIVLHPNDRPFGVEYRRMYLDGSDLSSCMTSTAKQYDAPHGVHPCDVYSCAHFGQGDNGLVLVEVQGGEVPVGRGILNVDTKQIVRWYGDHKAKVMLKNTFDIHVDSDALDDVQLALIMEGDKIAAPYLDGCQNVSIEGGVLLVSYDGTIEMDDTSGYQYTEERHPCVITDTWYPESELEYQPITETWFNPDYVGSRNAHMCPLIGEYCDKYSMSWANVHGCEERIADCVYYRHVRPDGWTDLGGDIGWVDDEDNYTYDDVTERYYPNDEYDALVAERKAEQEEENNEAA